MGIAHQQPSKAERGLHDQTNLLPRGKLIAVFATLSLSLLITFVDQNGIGVALPTIAAEIHAEDTISWAGTSSLIANTVFQMLYGRLSDIFGRKAIYLAAIGLLAVADLLCGLVNNPAAFYVFRGLAGVGGGGVTNLAMIIVSDIVTLEQRGKYQGIIGAMVGLGNVLGPFLAAAFIEKAHSWRAFFYLLTPLGAISGAVSFFLLPSKPPSGRLRTHLGKIDYLGWFASFVAMTFLLIPISGGGAYFSWQSPMVICMLTIGGCALVLFVLIEWKVAKLPMMPLSIFSNPAITVMLVQNFLLGAVSQAYLYYLPMYLQNAHRFSPLTSASISMAVVGTQTIASIMSGLYISRMKRYGEVLWFGFGLWTLGCGLSLTFNRHTSAGLIVPPLLVVGTGVGSSFQPILIALQAHSIKSRRAVIISNRNFFRCAGGACGLAVSAALLQATLRANLPPQYSYLADSTYAIPDLNSISITDASSILDAYMAASRAVFTLQIPLIGICFLGCLFIKDRGLEPPKEENGEQNSDIAGSLGEGIITSGSQILGGLSDEKHAPDTRAHKAPQQDCEKGQSKIE